MDNALQRIISQMESYNNQIESLDQFNITFFFTCLGFVGVLIGLVAAAFYKINEKGSNKAAKSKLYKTCAIIVSSAPAIFSIYTVVAVLNCRKVATYRGYLIYLENRYNTMESLAPQKYNSFALKGISKLSADNTDGSLMNKYILPIIIIGLSIFLILCFIALFIFIKRTYELNDKKINFQIVMLIILFILLIIICLSVSFIAIHDLYWHAINPEKLANEILSSIQTK